MYICMPHIIFSIIFSIIIVISIIIIITSRKPQAGDRVLGCIMLGSGLGRTAAVLALLASAESGGGRRWDSICAPRRDQTSCIPGTKMWSNFVKK